MKSTDKKGFTLIELLVVIAVIALLMSIVMPSLGKAKSYAQRVICSNNLRQQGLGTMLYSNENDSYVPSPLAYTGTASGTITPMSSWFWDVSFWCTNELSNYAGFDDNQTFTCPSNKMRKPEDARWWQFSMLSGSYPNAVTLRDEDDLTEAEQRQYFRVLPYVYFFDKYVKGYNNGDSFYGSTTTVSGKPMTDILIRKLSKVKAAGSKPMIMDAVISNANNHEFFDFSGGMQTLSAGTLTDDTNHRSRNTVTVDGNEGSKPAGANTAYADGHAEWKNTGNLQSPGYFENIECRFKGNTWFWW